MGVLTKELSEMEERVVGGEERIARLKERQLKARGVVERQQEERKQLVAANQEVRSNRREGGETRREGEGA